MTRPFHEIERVESRVLGALRFVDVATGATVPGPLTLRTLEGRARFTRNPSGLRVLAWWSGLAAHEAAFGAPPDAPAPGSRTLPVAVSDPTGRYLPRRLALALPRDPDPANAGEEDSLFRAEEVELYPAPGARTGANWAVLRVTVADADGGDALGGALVRVRRNGTVLGRGLTDGRGEALVAVPGVPMLTFGEEEDDAVVVDEITVTVEAVFDPGSGTRMTAAALRDGSRPPVPVVDPDALDADDSLPGTAQPLAVAARRSQSLDLALDLP